MKDKLKRICKNCRLFDSARSTCRVVILHEGSRINLPVEAQDPCFFEQEYFDPNIGDFVDFNDIKEVKFWVEDEEGNQTDKDGIVKIEYPENFFGDRTVNEILGEK